MKTYPAQPLDLMQYVNTKFHEPFIHEKIEYAAPPEPDRLIGAVGRLADAFPLIRCRYRESDNTFEEVENFRAAQLVVRMEQGGDALLMRSLDPAQKLIEFALCKNVLYVTASHLICDGNGFKTLLYALCGYYGGREVDGANFMNRDFSALFGGRKTSMFRMLASMLGGYKNRQIYERAQDERAYVIERTVDGGRMASVHAKAKAQNAALNDVLMTAYARAQRKLCGQHKVNIPCTSDLRKYAGGRAGIGNLTGSLCINIRVGAEEDFSATLKKVSRAMRRQKSSGNDIAGPTLLVKKYQSTSLEKFLKLYGGMNTSPYADYTNLGVLDEEKLMLGELHAINAVGYAGLQKAPYFMLAASTFRGALTLSAIVQCGTGGRVRAEALIAEVADQIGAFSGRSDTVRDRRKV